MFSDVLPTLTMDSDTQKLKKNIGSMVERLNKGAKLSHSSSGELFYYFIEFSFVILHCICISFYISCLSHFSDSLVLLAILGIVILIKKHSHKRRYA